MKILAKFAYPKLIILFLIYFSLTAAIWAQIPMIGDYEGNRYSTEFGLFLYYSSLTILTSFLPLFLFHTFNIFRYRAPLFIENGDLFVYVLGMRKIPIADIDDVVNLGSAGSAGVNIKLVLRNQKPKTFQTFFMAERPATIVSELKALSGQA